MAATAATKYHAGGLLAAICDRSTGRTFWVGFAVFGWGYVVLGLAKSDLFIPTAFVSDAILQRIHPRPLVPSTTDAIADWKAQSLAEAYHGQRVDAFQNISKCLWSPLLGFIGGLVARHFYQRRERAVPKN